MSSAGTGRREHDDLPFRHYSARHRLTAWVSQRIFGNVTYTVRHGLLKGMKRKGGLGFLPELLWKSVETPEIRFWNGIDLRGHVVYDVGAFQGLLALFFARQARQVVCYEPNRANRQRLLANLELNDVRNVTIRDVAVGAREGTVTMVVDPLMPGGGSADEAVKGQLLNSVAGALTETVPVTTLDADREACALPTPDFLKIDIEGLELAALQGARRTIESHMPTLFIEMHGETMNQKKRNAREIVAFLEEVGYTDIRHIESGLAIDSSNAVRACRGHLYCPRKPL